MNHLDIYQSRQEFMQEVIDRYLYLPEADRALFRSKVAALFEEFPINKTVQNSVHIIHRSKAERASVRERLRRLSELHASL